MTVLNPFSRNLDSPRMNKKMRSPASDLFSGRYGALRNRTLMQMKLKTPRSGFGLCQALPPRRSQPLPIQLRTAPNALRGFLKRRETNPSFPG